jgi:hypothetical protein
MGQPDKGVILNKGKDLGSEERAFAVCRDSSLAPRMTPALSGGTRHGALARGKSAGWSKSDD